MFSILKYELVKALHESVEGYNIDDDGYYDDYDNNIGECFERFFVAGCLYEKGKIPIPCFNCQVFYRKPMKYYLVKSIGIDDEETLHKSFGYRVIDETGFGFLLVTKTKEEAIKMACDHLNTLPIHIKDLTCNITTDLCNEHCMNCLYAAHSMEGM